MKLEKLVFSNLQISFIHRVFLLSVTPENGIHIDLRLGLCSTVNDVLDVKQDRENFRPTNDHSNKGSWTATISLGKEKNT